MESNTVCNHTSDFKTKSDDCIAGVQYLFNHEYEYGQYEVLLPINHDLITKSVIF